MVPGRGDFLGAIHAWTDFPNHSIAAIIVISQVVNRWIILNRVGMFGVIRSSIIVFVSECAVLARLNVAYYFIRRTVSCGQ